MNRLGLVCLCLYALPVLAEEAPMGWSGKGEVGLVAARGNSEAETLNLGAEFVYNQDQWRHTMRLGVLKASENKVDTADRIELGAKADYKVSARAFWYVTARYEADEFSEYDRQATLSGGYGYEILSGEVHNLSGEVGLGYRSSEVRGTGQSENEAIARGALKYRWQISPTASLSDEVLIEAGADNTFAVNRLSLTTEINDAFAVKLGHELRHNTDVTEPRNNSDFLTTVTLVYRHP